jgi:hypothetical protein
MTWSRSLADCTPEVADGTLKLQANFFARFAPWQLVVTRTAVSLDVQQAIWLQGRSSTDAVNAARVAAGLWKISDGENHKVTWTDPEKSLHVIIPGTRDKAQAVDLAIAIDPDGPDGPLKPKIDWLNGRYPAMAVMAESLGFEAGINFRPNPDPGHLQIRRSS